MAQPPAAPTATPHRPASDVYTVLVIIAAVFLVCAVGFLAWRLLDLYGTIIPPANG